MGGKQGRAKGGERKNKPPPPHPDQQTLERGEQLMILRRCVIPAAGKVSSKVLKAVVLNLGDHSGTNVECWQSQETIAEETGIPLRTVQRAVSVLEQMSLIFVRRAPRASQGRSGTTNRYRIIWNELKRLVREPKREWHVREDQTATSGGLVDDLDGTNPPPRTDQPATVSATNPPLVAHKATTEAPKKRPPPGDESEWVVVVDEFRSKQGIAKELADECRRAGLTPHDFRERMREGWATVELPENAGKFKDLPASVAWFVRRGHFPAGGVVTLEAIAERKAAEAAAAERATVERLRRSREESEAEQLAAAIRQRNATYGPILDSLQRDELRALVDLTPSLADPFHAEAIRRAVLSPPPVGLVRSRLLETLESLEATPADFVGSSREPDPPFEQPFWQRGTVR